jgi:hypothetical protein
VAETYFKEPEGSNLGDSALQEHIAHWADVLDRWVQNIDARLGRPDGADLIPPRDEADAGPPSE